MAKVILTEIDEQGNVTSDLSGFEGNECVAEEERFRRDLAEYGLVLSTRNQRRKPAENQVGGAEGHRIL
ncbi:MAG TPA: hypothetical protein PLD73_07355 [Candidatus Hydrogenedentes bacterium]|jgi:hypothetical protein|nr:hypothetical protein [Candidatus Hydrogenedentota bacterium]HPJ97901.1 hypothetical protein [Candidatus Hydrogenedentota bacterium]